MPGKQQRGYNGVLGKRSIHEIDDEVAVHQAVAQEALAVHQALAQEALATHAYVLAGLAHAPAPAEPIPGVFQAYPPATQTAEPYAGAALPQPTEGGVPVLSHLGVVVAADADTSSMS